MNIFSSDKQHLIIANNNSRYAYSWMIRCHKKPYISFAEIFIMRGCTQRLALFVFFIDEDVAMIF